MARHVPRPARSEPAARDPGDDQDHDEVRCDRAEADVEAAPLREERHERVDHVRPVREDLEHDVRDEERESAERDGTVHGLGDDPVARGHHDTVRGHDPDADRRCQRDQCEHARVEQHEVLGGEEDIAPSRGDPGGSRASDHYQQRDYDQGYDVATLGSLDAGHREVATRACTATPGRHYFPPGGTARTPTITWKLLLRIISAAYARRIPACPAPITTLPSRITDSQRNWL